MLNRSALVPVAIVLGTTETFTSLGFHILLPGTPLALASFQSIFLLFVVLQYGGWGKPWSLSSLSGAMLTSLKNRASDSGATSRPCFQEEKNNKKRKANLKEKKT